MVVAPDSRRGRPRAATSWTDRSRSLLMPVPCSLPEFCERLLQTQLLDAQQWDEIVRVLLPHSADSHELSTELISRGWLTRYQADQVAKGVGQDLVLGQYILLDLLGEGGMGQVFKAQQRRLKRLAALK